MSPVPPHVPAQVWVVERCYDYEPGGVLGVFVDRKSAEAFIRKHAKKQGEKIGRWPTRVSVDGDPPHYIAFNVGCSGSYHAAQMDVDR